MAKQPNKPKRTTFFAKVVVPHAREEYEEWVIAEGIEPDDIKNLETDTQDGDINQAMTIGPRLAIKAFEDSKVDWLTANSGISSTQLDDLVNNVFLPAAERYAKEEKRKKEERETRKAEVEKSKRNKGMEGAAQVADAIATIVQMNEDPVYSPLYQMRLEGLIQLVPDDKREIFYNNCLLISKMPEKQFGASGIGGAVVPALCLALVRFTWIDDEQNRKNAFLNSSLLK